MSTSFLCCALGSSLPQQFSKHHLLLSVSVFMQFRILAYPGQEIPVNMESLLFCGFRKSHLEGHTAQSDSWERCHVTYGNRDSRGHSKNYATWTAFLRGLIRKLCPRRPYCVVSSKSGFQSAVPECQRRARHAAFGLVLDQIRNGIDDGMRAAQLAQSIDYGGNDNMWHGAQPPTQSESADWLVLLVVLSSALPRL